MRVVVKYVTSRANADGTRRWYWQRPGHELVRLPASEPERVVVALRLNAEAEGRKPEPVDPATTRGTVAWLARRYRESAQFDELAKKTKVAYGVWLRRIEAQWGDIPILGIPRSVVVEWIDGIDSPGNKLLAAAVLSRLFRIAVNHDFVTANHALRLELTSPPARTDHFTVAEARSWLESAKSVSRAPQMRLAFWLLLYTGQRVADCLTMPWSRYSGARIELRQKKTRKLMAVPCHRELRAVLDAAKAERGASTLIVGGRLGYDAFNRRWRAICKAIDLPGRQARDMRRTTVIKLAEADCTIPQISAITGHSLADIKSMLDTVYLVRTDGMAEAAIEKWENADGTNPNATLELRLKNV